MFRGFRHPFAIAAAAGRVAVERDYERYVRNLILQALLTRPGERINRPTFGSGLRTLVFAPLANATATLAQTSVYTTLRDWLDAFIRVEDVRVSATEPATLTVEVVYLIRATNEQRFLNVEVTE